MIYFITTWTSSGIITGTGISPDGTLPKEAISCTQAQYENSSQYTVDASTTPPTIQQAPASVLLTQAQATQIALLKNGYRSAINAPVTFTNAAGVTSTYPSGDTILINGMRAKDLLAEVLSAGEAAWTLGKWIDSNDVAQTFTFSDLQGLAAEMEAAITLDYTDLVSKIAEVNAATTVSAVQAVTW